MVSSYLTHTLRSRFEVALDGLETGQPGREMLVRFFDGVQIAVLVTDSSTGEFGPKILFANTAFCDMCKYSLSDLLNQTPRLLQGPDTNLEDAGDFDRTLTQKGEATTSLINYDGNGTPYYADIQGAKLDLGSDRLSRLFITFTQRRELEAA